MRPVPASAKAPLLNSHTDERQTACFLSVILANAAEATKKGIIFFFFLFNCRLHLKPFFPAFNLLKNKEQQPC